MSGLEPPKYQELYKALVDDIFDSDLLEKAGAVFTREQFNVQIYWNQAVGKILDEILLWLDKYGPPEIETLLKAAIVVRPDCPRVRAFCGKYFPKALDPLDPTLAMRLGNFHLVQDVKLGLQVLSEHSGSADFQGALGAFRAQLQDTSHQINLLKRYKGLHNCLHNLQGQLVGIGAVVALSVQTGSFKGLKKIAFNLQPLASDARRQAAGLTRPDREIEWIDEFASYIKDMTQTALLATLSPTQVRNVLDIPNLLRALLRQQAPQINQSLVNAADSLRLDSFAKTENAIADKIATKVAPNDPVLLQLTAGVAAVNKLQLRLMALVDQHYDWQDLNTPLDEAVDRSEKHQPTDKIPKWDHFRNRLGELCSRYPDTAWSKNVLALMSAWITATPSATPDDAERQAGEAAFDEFCRACVDRFVLVDTELNDLSDEVAGIAIPLDKLLSQIP